VERRVRRQEVDAALHFASVWNSAAKEVRSLRYLQNFLASDQQRRRVEDLSVELYEAAHALGKAYLRLDQAETLEPHDGDWDEVSEATDDTLTKVEAALAEAVRDMKKQTDNVNAQAWNAEREDHR